MELDELHVLECCSGAVGDGDGVACGDCWVACFSVDLSGSATGEDGGACPDDLEAVFGMPGDGAQDGRAWVV